MSRNGRHNVGVGLGVLAVALLIWTIIIPAGIQLPRNAGVGSLSPGFWPRIVVGMAAAAGLALLVTGLTDRGPSGDIANGADASGQDPLAPFSKRGAVRLVTAFAALLLLYLFVDLLGLVVPAMALTALLMCLGGERRWHIVGPVALLLPLILYFFFARLARLPLPLGVFENLF